MKTAITMESEWKRRTDLIESADFRKECAKYAERMGITSQEWDSNKVGILMMIANEVCSHENKVNKKESQSFGALKQTENMRKIQTLIFAKLVKTSTSSTRAIISVQHGKTIKGQDYRNIDQFNTSNSVVDDARDSFEDFEISLEEMVKIIEGQGYNQIDK